MKLSEAFPSNYLKSDDLQGGSVTVVIADARMEKVGEDHRLVLSFQHKKKTMICNKTNAGRIAYLYGDETSNWIGKEIILFPDMVEYKGETVQAIRVRPPEKHIPATNRTYTAPTTGRQPPPPAPPAQQEPAHDGPSDEIPF